MNEIQKLKITKRTENGDIAYSSIGSNLGDIFFMTSYFEKHLDEVSIGNSEKEKLFSMYIRDPRFGLGRRDLGRKLMELSQVEPKWIVKAGRFDDLYNIASDECLNYLKEEVYKGNSLAKKWMPRLTGKDNQIAKSLCKMWGLKEAQYRKLIKEESTTEYKLSYAEETNESTPLEELFKQGIYVHPLVNEIKFEQVPSLAMTKYLHTFSTREDLKDRFKEYIEKVKENKAKINLTTANVKDARDIAVKEASKEENEIRDIVSSKIVDKETEGVEMNAIVILDTSGSMGWMENKDSLVSKAMSVAYAISIKSTYSPNQIISFSSYPKLMTIKGNTMKEKYKSMYTGDCSNTDFGKVMQLLKGLKKYPEYLIVLSDMEFDCGSYQSKEELMELFKKHGANTKLIWWNFNDRNKTSNETDEYGNLFLSGYNIKNLALINNNLNMEKYLDKILEKYKKDIDYVV